MSDRFSKATVRAKIEARLQQVESEATPALQPYGDNGTAQLRGNGVDVNRAVAYGEREALYWLLDELGL